MYKRQGKDSTVVLTLVWRALLAIRKDLGNIALARQVYVVNNDTPVSYTHLDVYKRQIVDIAIYRSTPNV